MLHDIALYDTSEGGITVTQLAITATDSGTFYNVVPPWDDFWMITFRTDKNIEVSASVTYIALQSVSDKFNYDETFDALWDTDNPDDAMSRGSGAF